MPRLTLPPLDRRGGIAWLVLAVGVASALVIWYSMQMQDEWTAQSQFDIQSRDIVEAIERRMRRHEQILLGGAGLFDASASVSREEWRTYVQRLRLKANYPGIQGVGFSRAIQPEQLEAHIAAVRAEGFPHFTVRPPGKRSLYTSIIFLEPFSERNLAAFGYDMFSEPTRRTAMTLAVDNDATAISGKVKLVQETHGKVQAGFLMYVPIYRKGARLDTPEARWQALEGFVYSPYRVDDLMRGILGERGRGIDLTIHDGTGIDAEALMHASADERPVAPSHQPQFTDQRQIQYFGRTWTISLHSRPEYEAQFNSEYNWLVLLLGCGISLSLFALTWSLISRREHALGLAQRMTEQIRRNESALQESVNHTQAVLDNVIDGIITIDEKGVIASVNKAAIGIFGYAAAEMIGNNVNMLMPDPYRSEHDGYLQNYRNTGKARIIGIGREVVGQRKNGSTFPLDLAVSEVRRADPRLFVGIVRDITERKRVERMKNEFVSTVSHELRTPLTSINGALGLITSGTLGTLTEQAQRMLDIALKNSQRLSMLINDLLDMEKIAAGKLDFDMRTQPLLPLVRQAIEANVAYGEQHGVRFALHEDAADIEVRIDGERLIQVLANFLSNAAKFSPADSTVIVAVRLINDRVRVEVTDCGPGVPEEFKARLFEKFSQADGSDTRQKGGTGLGLAISRELMQHMGGSVGFESEARRGATFFCEMPTHEIRGVTDAAAMPPRSATT